MKNKITSEQIHELTIAQMRYTTDMLADYDYETSMSDDQLDYVHAALDIARIMIEIDRDATDPSFCKRAIRAANKLLTPDSLDNFAGDGICQEIYDFVQKRYPETDMQA